MQSMEQTKSGLSGVKMTRATIEQSVSTSGAGSVVNDMRFAD